MSERSSSVAWDPSSTDYVSCSGFDLQGWAFPRGKPCQPGCRLPSNSFLSYSAFSYHQFDYGVPFEFAMRFFYDWQYYGMTQPCYLLTFFYHPRCFRQLLLCHFTPCLLQKRLLQLRHAHITSLFSFFLCLQVGTLLIAD